MSYRTILVHADESRRTAEIINVAASMAHASQAHLVGVATTGVSKFATLSDSELHNAYLAQHVVFMRERATRALQEFDVQVARLGLNSIESRLIEDEPGTGLVLQARYADLVVLGQVDLEQPSVLLQQDLPQYVLLHAARPVLIVPFVGQFSELHRHIMVAWDASPSATRAITHALPLLKQAKSVDVVVINPSSADYDDAHGEQPGADIALYLARHGVKVNVVCHHTKIEVGEALLSFATMQDASLIVMGGYGHTRFREVLLGGATRTILRSMTIPVFMSH